MQGIMLREEIFEPFEGNPVLTRNDCSYLVNAVFNPGAVRTSADTITMIVRVEDRTKRSHFNRVIGKVGEGKKIKWSMDDNPTIMPDEHFQENFGIEDPRIIFQEELGRYVITYTSHYLDVSPSYRISLMTTEDFETFERLGPILFPGDKDACLFPRKIKGQFAIIHRPEINGRADMWISFSPDLKYWGDSRPFIRTRPGLWDQLRVGLSAQPLELPEGWLIFYHGVVKTVSGSIYQIGLALLDLEEPWKVLSRTPYWVLGPAESYSQLGDVPGAMFPCAVIYWEEDDEYWLLCGVADKVISIYRAKGDKIRVCLQSCSFS